MIRVVIDFVQLQLLYSTWISSSGSYGCWISMPNIRLDEIKGLLEEHDLSILGLSEVCVIFEWKGFLKLKHNLLISNINIDAGKVGRFQIRGSQYFWIILSKMFVQNARKRIPF